MWNKERCDPSGSNCFQTKRHQEIKKKSTHGRILKGSIERLELPEAGPGREGIHSEVRVEVSCESLGSRSEGEQNTEVSRGGARRGIEILARESRYLRRETGKKEREIEMQRCSSGSGRECGVNLRVLSHPFLLGAPRGRDTLIRRFLKLLKRTSSPTRRQNPTNRERVRRFVRVIFNWLKVYINCWHGWVQVTWDGAYLILTARSCGILYVKEAGAFYLEACVGLRPSS